MEVVAQRHCLWIRRPLVMAQVVEKLGGEEQDLGLQERGMIVDASDDRETARK